MTEIKQSPESAEVSVERIGRNGYLHRVIPIVDQTGKVVQRVVKPLMVEFRTKDLVQTIIGASILAIPAAYTEETWGLGRDLHGVNILGIAVVSIFFVGIFVYYNFYRNYLKEFLGQYFIRVVCTYIVAVAVVALLLTLIDQCPWGEDNLLALKRIIVVAFPATMSATITDALK